MIKATPVQMRQSLEIVELMKKAGILFVPMPVVSEKDHQVQLVKLMMKLESMVAEIERAEEQEEGAGDG